MFPKATNSLHTLYTLFNQAIKSYLREVSVHVLHACKEEKRKEFIRSIIEETMLDAKE